MARPIRWYDQVQPATAAVPCGGEQHRVTWRHGKLKLENHDLSAERALLALGGEPCPCMRVLKMWRDQWLMPPDMLRKMASWLGPNAFLAPPELEVPRQLGLVRNWERSWRRGSYTTKHGQLLEDDLRRLASDALRGFVAQWATQVGLTMAPSITVRLAAAGHTPTIAGTVDGRRASIDARLGVAWLLSVWGRGTPVVDDGFVLEILSGGLVRAARWESDAPDCYQLRVERARLGCRAATGWSLDWISTA